MKKKRLLRITTVPLSLVTLLDGQLQFFMNHGFEVLAVSSKGTQVEQVLASGISHKIVNMTRKITPWRDMVALMRLIFVIFRFRPDIVHTHTPKAGLLGMMAATITGVPIRMHTIAGLPLVESSGIKRSLLVLTEKITFWCATNVYPNSIKLKEFVVTTLKLNRDKLKVIGHGSTNGIRIDYFKKTQELEAQARQLRIKMGIAQDEKVFCFIGRVVLDKGITELTMAFEKLAGHQKVRLFIIGPLEQELNPVPDDILERLKRNTRVSLVGFQNDIRPWLLASEIFILPSYREGFPNVVLQAVCMERPCIVSDINGCNEIIQNEVTGLVVPPKDTEALYQAMLSLLMDESKGRRFSRQALEFVIQNFDQQFILQELLLEYNSLLSKHKK